MVDELELNRSFDRLDYKRFLIGDTSTFSMRVKLDAGRFVEYVAEEDASFEYGRPMMMLVEGNEILGVDRNGNIMQFGGLINRYAKPERAEMNQLSKTATAQLSTINLGVNQSTYLTSGLRKKTSLWQSNQHKMATTRRQEEKDAKRREDRELGAGEYKEVTEVTVEETYNDPDDSGMDGHS